MCDCMCVYSLMYVYIYIFYYAVNYDSCCILIVLLIYFAKLSIPVDTFSLSPLFVPYSAPVGITLCPLEVVTSGAKRLAHT